MPSPRALFVKLSSLGDVIHLFPAISDLRAKRPEVAIDWAVEEAYAPLVRLHPAVTRVIPVGLRRLRSSLLAPSAWGALSAARRALREKPYDWIVDAQGLLKSVAVARLARGVLFGYDRRSIRERAAARFYDQTLAVPRKLHAVDRNRRLVGAVFGYEPEGPPDYGLSAPPVAPAWTSSRDYVVALHASSRAAKRWPDDRWASLAASLESQAIATIYPGGSDSERAAASRLAAASPGAIAAPALTLPEAAALLAHASAVVGVDTGLTHLAVALGTPTVGLYVATQPGLTGLHGGERAVSLGGPGKAPTVKEVVRLLLGSAAPA
ncbi:MAG TPA: lipopolysaccharide heptosyltransferase I [Usitatibacteraceae bacterium]|nr:lipopolysaccharide heptosyltransferase I [Usitatibacteraceae bacterium]